MSTSGDSPPSKKYELLHAIGRGGMGEVFLAHDLNLDRKVAVKLLHREIPNADWRVDLQREAKLLAQLNHANIVQVYDFYEHEGQPALVMEYVDGRNLHILLREQQCETGDILKWLSEVAAGLEAAHAAGITHNDLKAENVLVGRDGVAKVTDFGIAESEQDPANDILALGRLAQNLAATFGEIPTSLQQLIDRLSHPRAAKRPTAAEAAAQLKTVWLESTQANTELPPAAQQGGKPPLAVPLSIAAVIVLLSLAYLVFKSDAAVSSGTYVAVLPTEFRSPTGQEPENLLVLRSAVENALRQNVLDSPGLLLTTAPNRVIRMGERKDLAAALGADELLVSTLECRSQQGCELTLQRINGTDLTVIAQGATSVLADFVLESHSIVRNQWQQLYPQLEKLADRSGQVSEETYRQYLRLYEQAHSESAVQKDILQDLETLLADAGRFLPVYQLYAHTSLELYDETRDAQYLERLRSVLSYVDTWANGSLLVRQAWIQLALESGEPGLADMKIAEMEDLGADAALVNQLKGDRYRYFADYASAEKHYRMSLAMHSNHELYSKLADNYRLWGKPERAIETYRESLARYPAEQEDHGLLGMILLEQGRLDEAIAAFESLSTVSGKSLFLSDMGLAYLLQGNLKQAKQVFLEAAAKGVDDPALTLNLADVEGLLGNTEGAQMLYRELLQRSEAQTGSVDLWVLSQAYAQLGRYEEAIATLGRISGENAESAFNAALVYVLAEQDISALVKVEQALTAGFGSVWFSLPWFDRLCATEKFAALMSQAGYPDRCANPGWEP